MLSPSLLHYPDQQTQTQQGSRQHSVNLAHVEAASLLNVNHIMGLFKLMGTVGAQHLWKSLY